VTTATSLDLAPWLLTYALHSTIFLGVSWTVVRTWRLDHAARDVIWKLALVGGIVTATAQHAFDLRPVGTLALATPVVATQAAAAAPTSPDAVGTPSSSEGARGIVPVDGSAERQLAAESSSEPGDASGAPARRPRSAGAWLALLWLGAATVLVVVFAARRLVLTGRLGDRRAVSDARLLAMLDDLRASAEVAMPIKLTASSAISSPVALGAREICLPAAALAELEPEQLRAMLAHELAHLVRNDPIWLVLAYVIERALFFQPLNRLARAGLLHSAEYLADEWAARRAGGVPLAKALVKVAEWIQASPLGVPVAGFAEERSQLTDRVSRLLDRAAWGTPKSRWGIGMLAFATLVMMTAFAPGVARDAATPPGSEVASIEASAVGPTDPLSAEMPAPDTRPDDARARELLASTPSTAAAPSAPRRYQGSDTSLVRAVIERMRDEDSDVRRAAADALGRLQDLRAIDALVAALEDEDEDVRSAALNALGNFERGVPPAPIRRLLDSPDPEVRAQAVGILGDMKDRASIPTVTRLVLDTEEEVRQRALHALEEMDAPIAEELVGGVLDDRSADLRQTAASIAGERRMVTLVPKLITLLDDAAGDVREQAAHALTEMKTEASHRALRLAITHRDARVRRIAVSYLGEEGDK
jgi:beta-lactamase regulating signal transducer with metallopeptidase domain